MPPMSIVAKISAGIVALLLSILAVAWVAEFSVRIAPIVGVSFAVFGVSAATTLLFFSVKTERESRARAEKKIEQIEVRAEREPEKTRFAWDLARAKLEAYFDRNLSQVRMIFLVAVAVMVVGFAFVLWGGDPCHFQTHVRYDILYRNHFWDYHRVYQRHFHGYPSLDYDLSQPVHGSLGENQYRWNGSANSRRDTRSGGSAEEFHTGRNRGAAALGQRQTQG